MSQSSHDTMPLLVSIEGNIGSGKSTALTELERRGYTVVREPIDQWSSTLKLFYEDPAKYSFLLQARILTELVRAREAVLRNSLIRHKNNVIFFERSQKGAKVFVEVAVMNGTMNDAEKETYYRLEETMLESREYIEKSQVHILIDTPPKICCSRTVQRNRGAEQTGPLMSTNEQKLEYLKHLHRTHDKVFPLSECTRVNGLNSPKTVADDICNSLYNLKQPGV